MPSRPPLTAQGAKATVASHPTPSKGGEAQSQVFLRAPDHKYRINNLKAAKGGGTGQALEGGALRGTEAGQGDGWQQQSGTRAAPAGQGGQEDRGATPGG